LYGFVLLVGIPKGTSPGASKRHAQHLLDALSGSTAPAAGECLCSLTCFTNHLLSGKGPSCLAPWLCSAPLTALLKKGGGVCPIAVGEVLCCLANHLCCLIAHPSLPETFLPYGQVGVGIPGGLECAIQTTHHFLSVHGADDSLALLKADMKKLLMNAVAMLYLPIYLMIFQRFQLGAISQPAELHFGRKGMVTSSGVQQGDPLGPLLFSLVILQFIDSVQLCDLVKLYLDDEMFVGSRFSLQTLLSHFIS